MARPKLNNVEAKLKTRWTNLNMWEECPALTRHWLTDHPAQQPPASLPDLSQPYSPPLYRWAPSGQWGSTPI